MRQFFIYLGIAALMGLGWLGFWYFSLGADVARVEASIEFHNQRFKAHNRAVTFKADSVRRSGFPFHFRVRVNRPALTMISGNETYGISMKSVLLEPVDSSEGRYRMLMPPDVEAVYARDGQLPEQFFATISPVPPVLFRAQGDSNLCSPFPGGKACPEAAPEAPLISYAIAFPQRITLHMTRGDDTRDAAFDLVPLQIPLFMGIPEDISGPLEIAVDVFREAFDRNPAQ